MKDKKSRNFSTRAIHDGSKPDPSTGSIVPPIHMTSTYIQKSPTVHQGYEYTRCHNPTRTNLETALASLEKGKFCISTSSGMGSSNLLMHLLENNSKVLTTPDVYGGTYRLFTKAYQNFHNFKFIDTTDFKNITDTYKEFIPDMIWIESPSNPLLKISDIKKICDYAKLKNKKTIVVVDNTFMSPFFQNPLDLGADIVVHSLTKYINGHSDCLGGAIITNNKKYYEKLFFMQKTLGPSLSPFDSWLIHRGLRTLAVRMRTHEDNAIKLANYFKKHPKIEKVVYPGLKEHPHNKLAKKQMHGFGGMLGLYLKGDKRKVKKLLEKIEVFSLAESLGGVESLIEHPASMTHASIPLKEREKIGLSDQFIRISVGLEDIQDLINALESALKLI
jgi:cystathionine gamma-lyase